MTDPLHLLSPLDGRYADTTAPLRDHFSEFAFLRDRTRLELDFLPALSKTGLIRPLSDSESAQLDSIKANFSTADAESIRAFERETRHDVKAIEYFLRDKLKDTSLNDLLSWLHFGLTSEDVNNIAQAISLRDSRDAVLLPAFDTLLQHILGRCINRNRVGLPGPAFRRSLVERISRLHTGCAWRIDPAPQIA